MNCPKCNTSNQVVENGDDLTMRVEITKKANQFADNGYLKTI